VAGETGGACGPSADAERSPGEAGEGRGGAGSCSRIERSELEALLAQLPAGKGADPADPKASLRPRSLPASLPAESACACVSSSSPACPRPLLSSGGGQASSLSTCQPGRAPAGSAACERGARGLPGEAVGEAAPGLEGSGCM
jgi:hypothetical protein